MRISDWSSDVCSSDLAGAEVVDLGGQYLLPGLIDSHQHLATPPDRRRAEALMRRDLYGGITAVRIMADDLRPIAELARASLVGEIAGPDLYFAALVAGPSFFEDPRTKAIAAGAVPGERSEEHTSELQSLMRISYAVFCLKTKKKNKKTRM